MTSSVIILQPPLVQLNGPYPSGAYLAAFFRELAAKGIPGLPVEDFRPPREIRWIDVSNRFFHHLFSASGLTRFFELSREAMRAGAAKAESAGETESAFQLRRYLSMEERWINWIDAIVSILCGGDRELCHSFVNSPYAPRGARMDAFLDGLETVPGADDARTLATLALEDISDCIAETFDSEFSLVRYAESIAASERQFAKIEEALARPMVVRFLEPLLEKIWQELAASGRPDGSILFCISVPFPGCLVNALAMARSIRRFFGDRAVISLGGGYINTELRNCGNDRLFTYVDHLSFDRGFGGYADWFRKLAAGSAAGRRLECPPDLAEYEDSLTRSLVPDYSDIDFSRYPRLADNPNPMHRLWSDGAWLKVYLAHGCYWHRCSFCDVSLDYICAYRLVDVPQLYAGIRSQAVAAGVRGVHLVDEAAPPRSLRDFASENLKAGGYLSFWGNIRFEKTFTRDLADYLAAGGLAAVSGGIEIASPEGFKSVDKGIDLENLVAVCAAFKEAGVLVHSYLIYGYWNEDAQGVVDAVEVMRQLFAAGLIDSAFWHKFVLTRHSRVYREWLSGMHRGSGKNAGGLQPVDSSGDFADNDLRFAGEEESERYTAPLDSALQAWMEGEDLEKPVRKWFPYPMPAPRIAPDLIESYIASYEKRRDHERNRPCDPEAVYYWTGSKPVEVSGGDGDPVSGLELDLVWWHMGEEIRLTVAKSLAPELLSALISGSSADTTKLMKLPRAVFRSLRTHGLCKVSPLD